MSLILISCKLLICLFLTPNVQYHIFSNPTEPSNHIAHTLFLKHMRVCRRHLTLQLVKDYNIGDQNNNMSLILISCKLLICLFLTPNVQYHIFSNPTEPSNHIAHTLFLKHMRVCRRHLTLQLVKDYNIGDQNNNMSLILISCKHIVLLYIIPGNLQLKNVKK